MFERVYTILPSDAGARGTIKPRALLNCLQDTADMAVTELQADVHSVLDRGYAWILVHGNMEIERWASLGEKLSIKTWHNVNDGLYVYRAFDVRADNGSQVMRGKTSWLLLDLARGRPVKPKKNLPLLFIADGDNNPPVGNKFIDLPREAANPITTENFDVRLHDLDSNDHVNNAVYIEWAFEAVPKEISTERELLGWDVIYRKGAVLGNRVAVATQDDSNGNSSIYTGYTGIMTADGIFLCSVRTYWGE